MIIYPNTSRNNMYVKNYAYANNNNDRLFFGGPFLLGALTGGVAVAAFNPYRPRPYYPAPMYYGPPMYY